MATPKAIYRHGEPVMIDYTPGAGNVAAGDVVILGNTTGLTNGVAHVDLPNNVQGALACGGGVYELINLNNAANYVKVYWDYTNNKVTTVNTFGLFGYVVENGGAGANTACRVRHFPFA